MKLEAFGIQFSYNSHPVLADVSFTLKKGHIMAVMGINGAGKSTLLKCLNRILSPRAGSVLLDGEDLLRMSRTGVARRVGYVPQRHPENQVTVFEAVLMGRKPHIKWSMRDEDHDMAEKIIRQVGLAHLAMRSVGKLSGGELQKVVIARALAQAPDILLLDEPTSNLDLKNQLEVMALIRRVVREQGVSAIIAIHDLNMAVRFSDAFLFLKNGRIHAVCDGERLDREIIREVYDVEVILKNVGGHIVVVPQ